MAPAVRFTGQLTGYETMSIAHGSQRASAIVSTSLLTIAAGGMDAWVYLAHGHVFANAQSGNIVLMAIELAKGDFSGGANHLPSLVAFIAGLLISRVSGDALKHAKLNSRDVRLGAECVLLVALALIAGSLSDHTVTACVGFIAGVQITSLSHIGAWSFNTGMTTGNLRAAVSALSRAVAGAKDEWPHALAMAVLCIGFAIGALAGAWLTPRLGGMTLLPVAALVAAAIVAAPRGIDPIPGWAELG